MSRLEELFEENLKGLSDFMDEDTLHFYKGVINECMQAYARECCIATQKEIVRKYGISKFYEGMNYISLQVTDESITKPDNIVLL